MKVKKYTAGTMPEVMNIIRKELGPNAVILSSKEVYSKGFIGLFKKKRIEVFAGLDKQQVEPKTVHTKQVHQQQKTTFDNDQSKTEQPVLEEINYLKKLIEKQMMSKDETYPPVYQLMFDHLIDQEVTQMLADEIMEKVITYHTSKALEPSRTSIVVQTQIELEDKLKKYSSNGILFTKRIIQFVGPTGVGKTTTLAKVAAKYMMETNKKVALITMDTYRIAAIDQLKTYAKILNVPVAVAYSNVEYQNALQEYTSYDLILVDTAGRNFREEKYISDIKESSELNDSIETYLVLSLTSKQKDLLDIQKQFQDLKIKDLIFTKLDETTQFGSVLSVAQAMDKGIVYITNGQDVPDDLIIPSPKEISKLIIDGYTNE